MIPLKWVHVSLGVTAYEKIGLSRTGGDGHESEAGREKGTPVGESGETD
jgi:hypothetical protein